MRGSCKRHPSLGSAFTCERCGDFRCEGCRRTLGVRDLCPPCHALEARDESASLWAIGGAIFGFWGLGCAPVGWIGILLGVIALVLCFRSGKRAGRLLAAIGISCGVIGTVLLVVAMTNAVLSAPDPLDPAYDSGAWEP